jgi:hypothetical protein
MPGAAIFRRQPRTATAVAVGLFGALIAPAARAADGAGVAAGAAALFLPSEFGAAVSDPARPRLVIGWSWQIPLHLSPFSELEHHRLVPTVDLLPRADGASWRGRLGYRYDRNHVFGGAGVGVDNAGVNLSPELGVKFAQLLDEPRAGLEVSLHLLVRAEIAPESGHVRGATVLLGWNLF